MQGIEALVEAPETCSVRPSRRSWGTAGEQETGRRGSAPRERQRDGALLRFRIRVEWRPALLDARPLRLPAPRRPPLPAAEVPAAARGGRGRGLRGARGGCGV